ncbi:hypothetical protein E2P71_04970 [Candidatus Bathyarchaeota archaeon]|nr:hypothetical protein E2P71_04970 [Candidatus Bathyarchaeota archaeon]
MNITETLSRNYKQVIYLALFASLAIPMINPIGLPVPIDQTTSNVYNKVESLQPGDVVVLGSNIGAAIYAEVYPQYIAVMEHVLRKDGVKLILVEHGTEAPIFAERALQELNAYERKTYGQDFVNLGYIAGDEAAISGICRDLHALLQVDYNGYSLSTLPMMNDINGAQDFTIVIDFTASADSQFWLNQAYASYGTDIAFGLTAVKVPDAYAYYTAGQIFGIIESLKGAAGYELLIDRPGIAAKGMDAQSIAHLLYIALIVLGNLAFYMGGKKN